MKSKFAFICPIHNKGEHFRFGNELIDSFLTTKQDADLYFVFSDKNQRNLFFELYPIQSNNIMSIINPSKITGLNNQVNRKKINSLKKNIDNYDYIITIDCESIFIRKLSYEDVDLLWQQNDSFHFNFSVFSFHHNCAKLLNDYEYSALKKITLNFRLNNWFNNIPVYEKQSTVRMLNWLHNHENRDRIEDLWDCFDYTIYTFYMLLYEKKNVIIHYNIAPGGTIESLNLYSKLCQKKIVKSFKPRWVPPNSYFDDETFMIFQRDREAKRQFKHFLFQFRLLFSRNIWKI